VLILVAIVVRDHLGISLHWVRNKIFFEIRNEIDVSLQVVSWRLHSNETYQLLLSENWNFFGDCKAKIKSVI